MRNGNRVLLTLALVALAGCGSAAHSPRATTPSRSATSSSPELNTAHIAYAIEQSILAQRHIHATVSCPSPEPKRKGVQFVCIATTTAGRTPFVVSELTDQGYVHYVGK